MYGEDKHQHKFSTIECDALVSFNHRAIMPSLSILYDILSTHAEDTATPLTAPIVVRNKKL
jgi:hypothetical protein